MNSLYFTTFLFVVGISLCSATTSLLLLATPAVRRIIGLLAPLSSLTFFLIAAFNTRLNSVVVIIPEWLMLYPEGIYCGALFNFVYIFVFIAFGNRVFATTSAAHWLAVQSLISFGLGCENIELFALIMVTALVWHLKVSQIDLHQVSKKHERYVVVIFSTLITAALGLLFFLSLSAGADIVTFGELAQNAKNTPIYVKVLGLILIMLSLGMFPFHFWVRPLFGAPSRYGLAAITRLNIGFLVLSKLLFLVPAGSDRLAPFLLYGCGINLLFAAFLLFGERRMSQIVSNLYLFHVPLLLLAIGMQGHAPNSGSELFLDFANIAVTISGLLMITSMLRDRLGAEELNHASGLGISYPFLGISFLISVLSLVGFPGTLGFISTELILHHCAESLPPVAACFIVSLALNGYSTFRIFGESFYGDPAKTYRREFQTLPRERLAICLVLLFLLLSGLSGR